MTMCEFVSDLYWTAPELLRQVELPCNGTPKGDIYSFAIIMWELMYNSKGGPYQDINLDPKGLWVFWGFCLCNIATVTNTCCSNAIELTSYF